jgi:hypothetical protein
MAPWDEKLSARVPPCLGMVSDGGMVCDGAGGALEEDAEGGALAWDGQDGAGGRLGMVGDGAGDVPRGWRLGMVGDGAGGRLGRRH